VAAIGGLKIFHAFHLPAMVLLALYQDRTKED